MTLRIGILVSGRGSNLESILISVRRGLIKEAAVSVVISNRPEARALRIAKRHGVEAVAIDDEA